ncbi:MAG: hypothetical protein RLZZ165_1331 [Bacteroidota bacterium]
MDRVDAAFDPENIPVDDSTGYDLAYFVHAISSYFKYIDGSGREAGDWSDFITLTSTTEIPSDPEAIDFYLQDSDRAYREELNLARLSEPHRALFVAFLKMLEPSKALLNGFTRRHLDHYYRERLGLRPGGPVKGVVDVIFSLRPDASPIFLPRGTELLATDPGKEDILTLVTLEDMELSPAVASEYLAVRTNFVASGLRSIFNANGILEVAKPDNLNSANLTDIQNVLDRHSSGSIDAEDAFFSLKVLSAEQLFPPSQRLEPDTSDLNEVLQNYLMGGAALPSYRDKGFSHDVLAQDLADGDDRVRAAAMAYLENVLFMGLETFLKLRHAAGQRNLNTKDNLRLIQAAVIAKASTLDFRLVDEVANEMGVSRDAQSYGRTGPRTPDQQAWFPFAPATLPQDSEIAWLPSLLMLGSSVLKMEGGYRTITVTLDTAEPIRPDRWLVKLDRRTPKSLLTIETQPFIFSVSSRKGWVSLGVKGVAQGTSKSPDALVFTLEVSGDSPPIDAPGQEFPEKGIPTDLPLLRIGLRPSYSVSFESGGNVPIDPIALLSGFRLRAILIAVKVDDLPGVQAQTEAGVVDTSSPFHPFGNEPGRGSTMVFGHPELCEKKLTALNLAFTWHQPPQDFSDFGDYYSDYYRDGSQGNFTNLLPEGVAKLGNGTFTFRVDQFRYYSRTQLSGTQSPALFSKTFHDPQRVQVAMPEDYSSGWTPVKIDAIKPPRIWDSYFQLTWLCNFAPRGEYEKAQSKLATAINVSANAFTTAFSAKTTTNDNAAAIKAASDKLNADSAVHLRAPYIPKLKKFEVGYSAEVALNFATWQAPSTASKVYAWSPFGHREQGLGLGVPFPMIPDLAKANGVYLGIQNYLPGRVLSLMIMLEEGTGDPLSPLPIVTWRYLGRGGWLRVPDDAFLGDGTRALTQSGTIHLKIPEDAVQNTALMQNEGIWLHIHVPRHIGALPNWISLNTNAVKASPADVQEMNLQGFWFLPAGSVTGLATEIEGVESVSQPYPSDGGRSPESEQEFYYRSRERLRHRNRALTAWDYEHLVLGEFPEVYGVKVIQGMPRFNRRPGDLEVLAVPRIGGRLFFDPLQPRFDSAACTRIEDFLRQRSPRFAGVKVINPQFIAVSVRAMVKFSPVVSPQQGISRLNEELKRLLAPWAFEGSAQLSLGAHLTVGDVVSWIECLPYVEFVGRTSIGIEGANGSFKMVWPPATDTSAYVAASSDTVLTSAKTHQLYAIGSGDTDDQWEGIGYMKVELDLRIR